MSLSSSPKFIIIRGYVVLSSSSKNAHLASFLPLIRIPPATLRHSRHLLQVRRFSEAFFVVENPRPSACGCYDSNQHTYAVISDALRRSPYLALLPPLPVECIEVHLSKGYCYQVPFLLRYHPIDFARIPVSGIL